MPMLKSLCLWHDRQPHFTVDLGRSSQLKRVRLYGDFSIVASAKQLHRLKRPSSLNFQDYKPEDAVRSCKYFLSIAPFLKELHLGFYYGLRQPTAPGTDQPVYPGLRRLKLEAHRGPEVFIDNVTLPSLDALDFSCDDISNGSKLLKFLERSRPPLAYLSIHDAHESYLIPCLKLLPTLTNLLLDHALLSTRSSHEPTVSDNESDITCPLLEGLHTAYILCLGDSATCIESLVTMLESRCRLMETFEKVWSGLLNYRVYVHPSRLREHNHLVKRVHSSTLWAGHIREPFGLRNRRGA